MVDITAILTFVRVVITVNIRVIIIRHTNVIVNSIIGIFVDLKILLCFLLPGALNF
jgi:hypothetical protein